MKLKIECKSAVTPSSGESWGGVIDTDINYDEFGIPFITAKRIKGVLKESAMDVAYALFIAGVTLENCSKDDVMDLFGIDGQEQSCNMQIDNAYLSDYEKIKNSIMWMKEYAPELCTTEQVLGLFSTTRAQTAIADDIFYDKKPAGVALDHSLRLQRVLHRGLCFTSDISFDEKKYEKIVAMAAQVSRNLGLGRNRGLGNVKMQLLNDNDQAIQFNVLVKESDFLSKGGSNA